jgi:carbon storage regulator
MSRMLILVRKVQQAFWIEGDIWVKVLSVERDRVKLGITAPGQIKVMRQELMDEGESAVKANGVGGVPDAGSGVARDQLTGGS